MASGVYNSFKSKLMTGSYNLGSAGNTIKIALMDNAHAFTAEDDVWSDVSANEISGTGYTAGGATLANQAVSIDDADDKGVWDADDVVWNGATFTSFHAVMYNSSVTNDLVLSIDFGGVQVVSGGEFIIQWDAEGILVLD